MRHGKKYPTETERQMTDVSLTTILASWQPCKRGLKNSAATLGAGVYWWVSSIRELAAAERALAITTKQIIDNGGTPRTTVGGSLGVTSQARQR
jgi:hypothetical protein